MESMTRIYLLSLLQLLLILCHLHISDAFVPTRGSSSFCESRIQPHQVPQPLPLKVPVHAINDNTDTTSNDDDDSTMTSRNTELQKDSRRRAVLQSILVMATTTATASLSPLTASAGKPELDGSGELFSPQAEMLRGGSAMTRGVQLDNNQRPVKLKPGQTVQIVYEPRFIAYLSRFLLNFDPAARTWWVKQGLDDSWDKTMDLMDASRSASSSSSSSSSTRSKTKIREEKFAEFAESVEVGLSDYFVGPYGSYASLEAAKAGLIAAQPAPSSRATEQTFWQKLVPGMKRKPILTAIDEDLSKQGVLNLYTLLKARYTSKAAKRQLSILFSLISKPSLQPTDAIRGLVGEADNATISQIEVIKPPKVPNEVDSRTSSRRGGGYSILQPPTITVETPPALGDAYHQARFELVMKPTSRVLKINVIDGGEGYTEPPVVKVTEAGASIKCEACAVLDRDGHVESIVVLDPGYNYGQGRRAIPPKISIEAPKRKDPKDTRDIRIAKAEAELEFEIAAVNILDGGSGYVGNEFPSIYVSPPDEDPDWYVPENTYSKPLSVKDLLRQDFLTVSVKEMRLGDGTLIDRSYTGNEVTEGIVTRLQRDPLELLPSQTRPELVDTLQGLSYRIPSLPNPVGPVPVPSARYRAFDPIFGPIGRVPVTKGALSLSTSEYTRLALSGAVCTVIVRTVLNPLELVKTKIQLQNDNEIVEYALSKMMKDATRAHDEKELEIISPVGQGTTAAATMELTNASVDTTASPASKEAVGTIDMIKSLAELRGIASLFQSSDITFLASLVFGSFGFGATELFRRFFTTAFFSEEGGGSTGQEIILLAAAAVACVITSAAAAPFEVLRVKSMSLVEPKGWTEVLDLYLEDKKGSSRGDAKLKAKDLLPLWGGFAPTLSRELPFAVTKFLVFDVLAKDITGIVNAQLGEGAIPVQVGVGSAGLAISAISGAVAGVAGAIISHPADLILTFTSSSNSKSSGDWKDVVKDLLSREGGVANLFIGLPARSVFFFLVIGLQFFLYDYVKNIFQVGSEDLNLVLDVFYAVRQGLVDMSS